MLRGYFISTVLYEREDYWKRNTARVSFVPYLTSFTEKKNTS